MTSVAAGIKGLLSGARTVAGLIKVVESSAALQARFDEAAGQVEREIGQVSYAVVRALVASATGREPSHDDVNNILSKAVSDPAFPNRAYRLLGEARKSASRRRRAFLASVLFGLPFSSLPDDERDRVDMVVEWMMPADAELLWILFEKDCAARPSPEPDGPYFFKGTKLLALTRGLEVRIGSTDDWAEDDQFAEAVYTEPRFCVDHAALGALLSFGLADIGETQASNGDWSFHRLTLTPLGKLVANAIQEVRPGFDTSAEGAGS